MKFITVDTYQKLSRQAANIISAQVILKPDSVLGLATGSSPLGTYKQLIEWYEKGDIDFSKVTSVNLDEYVGLDGTNDQSYRYFMNKNFFEHINIDINNTFVPNGCAVDLAGEGKRYDEHIAELGGIDLQLLGIGLDGHIGFNEPDKYFVKSTDYNGYGIHYAGEKDFTDCKRKGKAGYSRKSLLRTDNSRNPRFDSSTPP